MSESRPQRKLHARKVLRAWTRVRELRARAAESLELAHNLSNVDVQNRYLTIADHYRELAEVEERIADQESKPTH